MLFVGADDVEVIVAVDIFNSAALMKGDEVDAFIMEHINKAPLKSALKVVDYVLVAYFEKWHDKLTDVIGEVDGAVDYSELKVKIDNSCNPTWKGKYQVSKMEVCEAVFDEE